MKRFLSDARLPGTMQLGSLRSVSTDALGARVLWFCLAPTHIFFLAAVIIVASGRWHALVEQVGKLQYLLLGILGGVGFYFVSLCTVRARVYTGAECVRSLVRSLWSSSISVRRVFELGARALYEEAFWRGTLQVLLANNWLAICGLSILFTLQHIYYARINSRIIQPRVTVELFLFALTMGFVYSTTGQLLVVVGVHWMRNVLIDLGCSPQPSRRTH